MGRKPANDNIIGFTKRAPEEDYVPEALPCGKRVNQLWRPGMPIQSCRTVCPSRTFGDIDACYTRNKARAVGA